jgi:hypothetical protein
MDVQHTIPKKGTAKIDFPHTIANTNAKICFAQPLKPISPKQLKS